MNNPLVYIILLNYNGYLDTIECIESIEKINYENYKIIVVDNFSKDNSEQIIKQRFPKYEVIQSGSNLGFAGGCNLGIKRAIEKNADYILLLNNDTIVDKNFLSEMILTAETNNRVGIVGGKIYYYKDKFKLWYDGGEINKFKGMGCHYNINKYDKNSNEHLPFKYVSFVTGCLMLIKKDVIKKVGYLPEDYFLYFEDVDYCVDVQKKYKLLYNPNAVIYHKESSSTKNKSNVFYYYFYRNRKKFILKCLNKRYKYIALINFYFYTLAKLIQYKFVLKNSSAVNGIKKALRNN